MKKACLVVLACTLTACSSPQPPIRDPARVVNRARFAIVPASNAPEHLGGAELSYAWRIDTQNGDLSYCTYNSGTAKAVSNKATDPERVTCTAPARIE